MTVVPAYYHHPAWEFLFGPMWMGLIRFSSTQEDAVEQFQKDSGCDISFFARRSPFDALIDRQTGREREVFTKFLDWVTSTQWGLLGSEDD